MGGLVDDGAPGSPRPGEDKLFTVLDRLEAAVDHLTAAITTATVKFGYEAERDEREVMLACLGLIEAVLSTPGPVGDAERFLAYRRLDALGLSTGEEALYWKALAFRMARVWTDSGPRSREEIFELLRTALPEGRGDSSDGGPDVRVEAPEP